MILLVFGMNRDDGAHVRNVDFFFYEEPGTAVVVKSYLEVGSHVFSGYPMKSHVFFSSCFSRCYLLVVNQQ